MDITALRARAARVTVANSVLPTLSLHDTILYLCGHGGSHFWYRVFWLVDLAEIIRRHSTIDWQHLMTLADAAGLRRQLVLGIVLAHKFLDAPLHETVLIQSRGDHLVSYMARISCRYMLCPDPEDRPLSLSLHLNACSLRGANSFREKLNFLQEIFLGRE